MYFNFGSYDKNIMLYLVKMLLYLNDIAVEILDLLVWNLGYEILTRYYVFVLFMLKIRKLLDLLLLFLLNLIIISAL